MSWLTSWVGGLLSSILAWAGAAVVGVLSYLGLPSWSGVGQPWGTFAPYLGAVTYFIPVYTMAALYISAYVFVGGLRIVKAIPAAVKLIPFM